MGRQTGRSSEASEWRRLYDRQQWKRLRRAHLGEHPCCRFCEATGLFVAATVVDHIQPHKGDERLFFDPTNLQSLCKPHHDAAKAQIERWGFHTMADAKGYPTDPNHPANR